MTTPYKKITIKIPLDLIPDFHKLLDQFDGVHGTDEEFADYIMTVFLLNHSRKARIDPDFDA